MAGRCRPRPAKSGALPLVPSRLNQVKSVPLHLLHIFPNFSLIFGAKLSSTSPTSAPHVAGRFRAPRPRSPPPGPIKMHPAPPSSFSPSSPCLPRTPSLSPRRSPSPPLAGDCSPVTFSRYRHRRAVPLPPPASPHLSPRSVSPFLHRSTTTTTTPESPHLHRLQPYLVAVLAVGAPRDNLRRLRRCKGKPGRRLIPPIHHRNHLPHRRPEVATVFCRLRPPFGATPGHLSPHNRLPQRRCALLCPGRRSKPPETHRRSIPLSRR